jgi:hypothetical protein
MDMAKGIPSDFQDRYLLCVSHGSGLADRLSCIPAEVGGVAKTLPSPKAKNVKRNAFMMIKPVNLWYVVSRTKDRSD